MATLPAVLLVDDNPDDVFFFQLAWEKAQLASAVRFVASCREAKDYLDGAGQFRDRALYPVPSVVVLDMRLPDGRAVR